MQPDSNFSGKSVLVTGGAGAIGSNLVTALLAAGASEVTILDDLSSAFAWNVPPESSVTFIEGDILNDEDLNAAFANKPDVVYHLAALFANQNSIENPEKDLLVNGLGTINVLNRSVEAGVDKLIYASSSSSFSNEAEYPLKEDHFSLKLNTPYQISKLMGELYCGYFTRLQDLPTVRIRIFNSYGPGEMPGKYRNVIPNFIYTALKGEPLTVMGTGEASRDWTYIDDICNGFLLAGSHPDAVDREINMASGKETRVIDLANLINELTDNKAGIEFIPQRDWDTTMRRVGSIELAKSLVGYQPTTQLRDGLAETINWFKRNWEDISQSVNT